MKHSLSSCLLACRIAMGLTQRRMARRLRVSASAYCAWERGTSQPRPAAMMRARKMMDTAKGVDFSPGWNWMAKEKRR